MTSFWSRVHSRVLHLAAAAVTGIVLVAVIASGCCIEECHRGCPDTLPVANSECYSVDPECGPYEVSLPCGVLQVTARCDGLGIWTFDDDCGLNCGAIADEQTCDGTFGCMWVEPCSDST